MRHVRSSSFSHELLLLMKLLPLYEERKDPTVDIATNIQYIITTLRREFSVQSNCQRICQAFSRIISETRLVGLAANSPIVR